MHWHNFPDCQNLETFHNQIRSIFEKYCQSKLTLASKLLKTQKGRNYRSFLFQYRDNFQLPSIFPDSEKHYITKGVYRTPYGIRDSDQSYDYMLGITDLFQKKWSEICCFNR